MPYPSFTLLHGPRERERTARLVQVLGEMQATGPLSALVFVPTEARAEQLRVALRTLGGGPGRAALYPSVTTFSQFMQRHYAVLLGDRQFVPDLDRIPLLREVLRAQPLPLFDSLPDSWGRAAMALQALELVQQSLPPNNPPDTLLADLAPASPGAVEALRSLEAAYRHFLQARGLADRNALATELLQQWQTEGYHPAERALTIDGFAFFFTPLQRAVFSALVPAFETVLVTLAAPAEGLEAGAAHRGFQKTAEALDWLGILNNRGGEGRRGTGRAEETRAFWSTVAAVVPAATLPAQVQERLFTDSPERLPLPPPGPGSFRLLRAPNRREEVRLVARLIRQQLMREGAAASLEDHLVVAPELEEYTPLVREVFAEYGLPVRPPQGEPLQRVPLITVLRKLLSGAVEGWSPAALFDVLAAPWVAFTPVPPGEADLEALLGEAAPPFPEGFSPEPFSIARLDRWRRQAGVHQDFDPLAWFAALDRALQQQYGQEDPVWEDYLADQVRYQTARAQAACDVGAVTQFVEQVQPLGRAQSPGAFAERFRNLLHALDVEDRVFSDREETPERARNRAAYGQFCDLLDQLERLFVSLEGGATVRPALLYLEWLTRRLAEERCRLGPPRTAAVRFLSPAEAGSLQHKALYLMGLVEGAFPRRPRANFLFRPDGVEGRAFPLLETLPTDRFLFQQMVGNAETVVLTYPRLAEGQELSPSPFLEEVRAVFAFPRSEEERVAWLGFGEDADRFRRAQALDERLLAPLTETEETLLLSPSEVLQRLGQADRPEGWERLALPEGNVATQLTVERARESRSGFSSYDGHLDATTAAQVRTRFEAGDYFYSITQIEEYAQCPLKFFFNRVLGLTPVEEVDDEIAPDVRGRLVHRILERFYAENPDLRRRQPEQREWARETLERVAEEEMERYDRAFANLYWEEEKRTLRVGLDPTLASPEDEEPWGLLRAWLEKEFDPAQERLAGGFAPAYFEYHFGPFAGHESEGPEWTLPRPEGGTVRVRGKVDRVDLAADPPRFAVYDYKTGRAGSPTAVERGLSFQLPVYLLALQSHGLGQPAAGAYYVLPRPEAVGKSGYLGDESTLGGGRKPRKFYPPADFLALLGRVQENVLTLDQLIREGKFNPSIWEDRDAGCRYCDFATICRYNATRQLNLDPEVECYRPSPWESRSDEGGP